MVEKWEKLESRRLARYPFMQVRQDRVRSPRTGEVHDFYVLEMRPWINVVPLTPEGKVVMIHQYRHGLGEIGLEIPGGIAEGEDASLSEAARRELLEETGYDAGELIFLGKIAPNPAIQDNWCHTFLALGARRVRGQNLDPGEDIRVEEIDLTEIPALIEAGRINHGLIVIAFCFLDRFLKQRTDLLPDCPRW